MGRISAPTGRRFEADNTTPAIPNVPNTPVTSCHVTGAVRSGNAPKPPASEPKIAPNVLHDVASPACRPKFLSARPSSAMSNGNCSPLTIAAGSTTTEVRIAQETTWPKKLVAVPAFTAVQIANRSPNANGIASASASRPQVNANSSNVGMRFRNSTV